jgi:hypothetical protein
VTPDRLPDPVSVAVSVTELLDRVGIPYVIGGSFASSLHGEPRSTNDVDVVVDLRDDQIAALIVGLRGEYYVDEDAVVEAVGSGGSFNIIHMSTAVKIDVFVAGEDAFDRERLARRQLLRIPAAAGKDATVFVDTAEDTILRKLEWFRRGREVSERQWRDALGILRTQAARLDDTYLHSWAGRLGVSDLLDRAMREAAGR